MDPTTVLMERATAEWAAFLASLPYLALEAAFGLVLLLGCAIVMTILAPPREYPAMSLSAPEPWDDGEEGATVERRRADRGGHARHGSARRATGVALRPVPGAASSPTAGPRHPGARSTREMRGRAAG